MTTVLITLLAICVAASAVFISIVMKAKEMPEHEPDKVTFEIEQLTDYIWYPANLHMYVNDRFYGLSTVYKGLNGANYSVFGPKFKIFNCQTLEQAIEEAKRMMIEQYKKPQSDDTETEIRIP